MNTYRSVSAALAPAVRRTGVAASVGTLLVLVVPIASAQSGGGYELSRHVIAGGGLTQAAGGGFTHDGTAGQPAAGSVGGSGYSVGGGFWGNALPAPPSPTPASSPTSNPSLTATATTSPTPTKTNTVLIQPTATVSPTAAPAVTGTGTPTHSVTPTPMGSATPTPTATGLPGHTLGGRIRYYRGVDRGVGNVPVSLHGSALHSTMTDAGGNFAFPAVAGSNWELQPEKIGDIAGGVSALDASYVLQSVVGLRTLSAEQQLACDVSGNGSVSALDASRILQLVVGIISRLPAGTACQSDWLFVPVPAAALNQRVIQPQLAPAPCSRGAIAYEPLAAAATGQDFLGILLGDCTGNWQPGAGAAAASRAEPLRQGRLRRARDGRWHLPLYSQGQKRLRALDMRLPYDPTRLQAVAVRRLPAASAALVESNLAEPGVARIAVAAAEPIVAGEQPLLMVVFDDVGGDAARTEQR